MTRPSHAHGLYSSMVLAWQSCATSSAVMSISAEWQVVCHCPCKHLLQLSVIISASARRSAVHAASCTAK